VGGGGLPAGELVGDELLDVLALQLAGEERFACAWQYKARNRTASV
jgi:hypothetical protein